MANKKITEFDDVISEFVAPNNHIYIRVFTLTIFKPFLEYIMTYFTANTNRKIYITTNPSNPFADSFIRSRSHLFSNDLNNDIMRYGNTLIPNFDHTESVLYIHFTTVRYDDDAITNLRFMQLENPNVKLIYVEQSISKNFPTFFLYNIFRTHLHFERKDYDNGMFRYKYDRKLSMNDAMYTLSSAYHRQRHKIRNAKRKVKCYDYMCYVNLLTGVSLVVKYNHRFHYPPKKTNNRSGSIEKEITHENDLEKLSVTDIITELMGKHDSSMTAVIEI